MAWDCVDHSDVSALASHPDLEVFTADAIADDWISLAHRMAGLVLVSHSEFLRFLCYVITTGIHVPIVMALPRSAASVRHDLMMAGAADCVDLPLQPDDVDRLTLHVLAQTPAAHVDRSTRIMLDPLQRMAMHHGECVRLAPREFALLNCLSTRSGQPISAEELLQSVWGRLQSRRPRQILEVTIHELRHKLARIGLAAAVVTVRGYGYALRIPEPSQHRSLLITRASPGQALEQLAHRVGGIEE